MTTKARFPFKRDRLRCVWMETGLKCTNYHAISIKFLKVTQPISDLNDQCQWSTQATDQLISIQFCLALPPQSSSYLFTYLSPEFSFSSEDIERLQFLYQQMHTKNSSIHWPDKIANKYLQRNTAQESVLNHTRIWKLNWFGHMLRSIYIPWAIKNVPLCFWLELRRFLVDFYNQKQSGTFFMVTV